MESRTKLVGLHPVMTFEDGSKHPHAESVVCDYKVRFSSPTVAPLGLPPFPYSLTYVGTHELLFTALIRAESLQEVQAAIEKSFDRPQLVKIEVDCKEFSPEDVLEGSQTRGLVVYQRRSLGIWGRFTSLFK